ncbi:kinase-like protein [Gigaspora margarita]|uniref:Kinase-like protein n=1 Tax=Gigaspora margarita TaxID=4874 RepID=A0A8H3ZYX1_GIGMA|nr:kinase-like protein [Gigaspora margarita]
MENLAFIEPSKYNGKSVAGISKKFKFQDYIAYEEIKKISGKEIPGEFSIIEPSKYNGVTVAVKIPKKINNKKKKKLAIDEIRKHDYFYCKYIISFRGITVLPNETAKCLIMDYAENGNLHEYLSEHPLEPDIKLKMAINLAEGLIKDWRLRYDTDEDFENEETVRWAAPERFSEDPEMKRHYKENPEFSDIYSYGLVLLEIAMNGIEPYRDMGINEIKEAKKNAEISINISDLNLPGGLEKIIKECCNSRPSDRSALVDIILELKNLHYKKSRENLENDPEKLTKFYFAEEKYEYLVRHLSKLLEANGRNAFMLKYRGAAYYF